MQNRIEKIVSDFRSNNLDIVAEFIEKNTASARTEANVLFADISIPLPLEKLKEAIDNRLATFLKDFTLRCADFVEVPQFEESLDSLRVNR